MKLLLDEMYSGLKEYFETLGWETLTVRDVEFIGIESGVPNAPYFQSVRAVHKVFIVDAKRHS